MALTWTDSTLTGLEDGGRGAEPQKLEPETTGPQDLTNSTPGTPSPAWL